MRRWAKALRSHHRSKTVQKSALGPLLYPLRNGIRCPLRMVKRMVQAEKSKDPDPRH
jgi:hypothetical protein